MTAVPQFASDGTLTGVINTLTNITKRKQAERALEERTRFLNSLIENTPLGIVAIGADHTVQMCNPAFETSVSLPSERDPRPAPLRIARGSRDSPRSGFQPGKSLARENHAHRDAPGPKRRNSR